MKMTWYSTCSLLLFLFTTNGKKRHTWMRTTSVTVMVVFFKSGILKVTWSQLCSFSSQLCSYLITPMITNSPFSTIPRHIDNSILKDILQLYILRTRINMRAKSFIKTSVNVTETKIDDGAWKKISHAKLQAWTWKNIFPQFIYLFFAFFSTFDISQILKFIQCLYVFL